MAWKAQLCPFCEHKFANIKGIKEHLLNYTGRWRYPADGIHDVSEIKNLLIMKDFFDEDKKCSYRCPSCAKVIGQRRKFIEHVVYRQHYVDIDGVKGNPKSPGFSFDPEPYEIGLPKATFPFLTLPPEIRDIIYKAIFCFDRIEINWCNDFGVEKTIGVWLQHNPPNNPLAIMATSRQVYHEARRIFCRYNTFIFDYRRELLIFLIGIGKSNASLLKTVKWRRNGCHDPCNHIEIIEPFIRQKQVPEGKQEEANIWNDEVQYCKLFCVIMDSCLGSCPWYWKVERPTRLDAICNNMPATSCRKRFEFCIKYYEDEGKFRAGRAVYELPVQFVKEEVVLRVAHLHDRETTLNALHA